MYYSLGSDALKEEEKLVDEINASRSDKKKYDELMLRRKAMFLNAIPSFEKAYSLIPTDENTKKILTMAYEASGQPEKAKAIK